jgi:hypothetical protein
MFLPTPSTYFRVFLCCSPVMFTPQPSEFQAVLWELCPGPLCFIRSYTGDRLPAVLKVLPNRVGISIKISIGCPVSTYLRDDGRPSFPVSSVLLSILDFIPTCSFCNYFILWVPIHRAILGIRVKPYLFKKNSERSFSEQRNASPPPKHADWIAAYAGPSSAGNKGFQF